MRAACVLAALTISATAHAADITYEPRALTGTDGPLGPGLGAGVNFSFFDTPLLNGAGQTAFIGHLSGAGVTSANMRGIWSEGGGSGMALVARMGNPAPGTAASVSFSGFSFAAPVLNAAGQTAFFGSLTGTSANNEGIWSEGGGSGLALVVRKGDPAPGTAAGVSFSGFFDPVLNGGGQTAFTGFLTGSGVTSANNEGIWSEGGGSGLALVVRKGDPAPGTAAGVTFGGLHFPVLNDAGQTAFLGFLTGAGVAASNDSGIWSEGGGSGLALVARKGSQAPGTPVGVNFNGVSTPVLNGAGQTAFVGKLTGAGVDNANNTGIWSEGGGSGLALVAREGSQAPGTDPGASFGDFSLSAPVLNGAGQTAFVGKLTGSSVTDTNAAGIWSEGGGSGLAMVARAGSQAPGMATGVNFSFFDTPVLNGAGQTAFRGNLTGEGVTGGNGRGIWATDLDGLVHLVAREGDIIDVSNDPLSFNDAGQLAFRARFTDGSEGIFVATFATPLTVTITPAIAPATGYNLKWYSRPGKVYDVVTSTYLVTPVAQWSIHAAYGDIPATGTTTTLTAVPVDGPQRFFAVIEKDAPPAN
jgi:hypothetical protein